VSLVVGTDGTRRPTPRTFSEPHGISSLCLRKSSRLRATALDRSSQPTAACLPGAQGTAVSLKVYPGVGMEILVTTTEEKTLSVHVVRERLGIAALLVSLPLVALILYLFGRRT
jgi:hypothetical protein